MRAEGGLKLGLNSYSIMRTGFLQFGWCALSVGLVVNSVMADLRVPYAPDESTLHLWRFNNTTLENGYYIIPDEGMGVPMTLTNRGLPANNPPFTNVFNQTPVTLPPIDLGASLRILHGGGTGLRAYAMAAGPGNVEGTTVCNPETGAFTFEALICPMGPLFESGLNWQIFCGDNNGSRGWHFRIQTGSTPQLNFNFINPNLGNFTVPLPLSGPNAVTTNQWYHVAVVYTGNAPTNGDIAGELRFYWTLLDPNKEIAAPLATNYVSNPGVIGNGVSIAVGGSQRTINGVGNGEGFVGYIDEVRISSVARRPDEMAFMRSVVVNPPVIMQQPPESLLVAYGKPLLATAIVSGTEPLTYSWQFSTDGQTFVVLPGQTNNSLEIAFATFANEGYYRLVVANPAGSVTSSVVHVTIGAAFIDLYNTGIALDGRCDTNLAGNPDPHYQLVLSSDMESQGPEAIVWNMFAYPIAMAGGGGMYANPDGLSQWIGPRVNSYTSPQGKYVYRTKFCTDGVDLSKPVVLEGRWAVQTTGIEILLNGKPTGNASRITNSPHMFAAFVITNGFVPGINTLDFVTECVNPPGNNPANAIRVQITSLGYALPPGPPTMVQQPQDITVCDAAYGWGSKAVFEAAAVGRPPLRYQWYVNGMPMSGQTNRTLVFENPTGISGTQVYLVVNNDYGAVTSRVARLTLVTQNRSPVATNALLITRTNTPLQINLGELLANCYDPDGHRITIGYWDFTTTNNVALESPAGSLVVTYTPLEGYVGYDQFKYYVQDAGGATGEGVVVIRVIPEIKPGTVTAQLIGQNIRIRVQDGTPGWPIKIVSSQNLLLPLSAWTIEYFGQFGPDGTFTVDLPYSGTVTQKFYAVAVQQ